MEIRMGKLASGLVLVLLSAGLGGCQLLGSEKASEANDSAVKAPKKVPAKKVASKPADASPKPKSVKAISATPLTRPTDPDVRVKAIKKGRSNPFAQLVTPPTKAKPIDLARGSSGKSSSFGTKSALKKGPSSGKTSQPKSNELPRLTNPTKSPKTNEIVLPPLPEPTLAKQVSVQGVMMLGGQPKAILKSPNAKVARTVQAGDYLENGQILVSSIDMSNPQNPIIVLKESGQTVMVGVGKSASAEGGKQSQPVASALPF